MPELFENMGHIHHPTQVNYKPNLGDDPTAATSVLEGTRRSPQGRWTGGCPPQSPTHGPIPPRCPPVRSRPRVQASLSHPASLGYTRKYVRIVCLVVHIQDFDKHKYIRGENTKGKRV